MNTDFERIEKKFKKEKERDPDRSDRFVSHLDEMEFITPDGRRLKGKSLYEYLHGNKNE